MRVNVYAEEMTDRIEIITKETDDGEFTGLRFYLELPVTLASDGSGCDREQVSGPFIHKDGDDDSAAVTFWGKQSLIPVLEKALAELLGHYGKTALTARWDENRRHHKGDLFPIAKRLARAMMEEFDGESFPMDIFKDRLGDDFEAAGWAQTSVSPTCTDLFRGGNLVRVS